MMDKLYIGLIVVAFMGAVIGLAEMHGYQRAENEYEQTRRKELEAAIAKSNEQQAQIHLLGEANAKLATELKLLQPEAHKHANQDQRNHSVCNLSVGAAGVLNVRRGYPSGSPDNPIVPAAKAHQPSTLTGQAVIGYWEECETRYQIAKGQLNHLIDSVQILQ
jgi:hypothetical protein